MPKLKSALPLPRHLFTVILPKCHPVHLDTQCQHWKAPSIASQIHTCQCQGAMHKPFSLSVSGILHVPSLGANTMHLQQWCCAQGTCSSCVKRWKLSVHGMCLQILALPLASPIMYYCCWPRQIMLETFQFEIFCVLWDSNKRLGDFTCNSVCTLLTKFWK